MREVMGRKEVWFWWNFCRKKTVYTKQCIMFMKLLRGSRTHEEDISRPVCILCNEAMEDRTIHVYSSAIEQGISLRMSCICNNRHATCNVDAD